jgi:hypothetical protein
MTFYIKVRTPSRGLLECSTLTKSKCKIVFKRDYTPVLNYISPQVVYYGHEVDVFFNPKGMLNLITDLRSDEKFFVNAKIYNALIDFEFYVDSDDYVSG